MTDRNITDQGYDTLRGLWDKTKQQNHTRDCLPDPGYGFWHAGNTLDTFMDYLGRAQPQDYKKTAAQLAEEAVTIFKETSFDKKTGYDPTQYPLDQPPLQGCWWDDYGWWGIAFLKVHQLTGDDRHLHVARVCWHFMEAGGRHYQGDNPAAEKGGTWNHDPKDKDPGIQNVVTNGLFLILSARLYIQTRDKQYLDGALAQYHWFVYQLDHGAKHELNDDKWLIEQLPLDKANGFWTGDQGVLLGGLASLRESILQEEPKLAVTLSEMCMGLVSAVETSDLMVWPLPHNQGNILHELQKGNTWRFDLNGSVGKGVLMRYVAAYLEKRDHFVNFNAAAVTNTLQKDGTFANSWVGDPEEKMNDDGCPNLGVLTRQCSGQNAMNASLLPPWS